MSVVGIVKKNGYPKFLSINSPNKFSNRWMVILEKKMLDPKKRVLAFKIERLAYVMWSCPFVFFFNENPWGNDINNDI